MKNKEERIHLCFRYKCKQCPRQRKCDEEIKKEGDTIERRKANRKTRKIRTKHSKWYDSKTSI